MAFSFGFFNSKNLDRTYTAENFNEYLSSIICDGIQDSYGKAFNPSGDGLQLTIGSGKAWIDGHYFISDSSYSISLSKYVDESLPRYVTIGICCNTGESYRNIGFELLPGTPASSPYVPHFSDTDTKTYLEICTVRLDASAEELKITDYRDNETYCGYVRCILGKCRVTDLMKELIQANATADALKKRNDELADSVAELKARMDDYSGGIIDVGKCGDEIFYTLYSNGTLLLRGTGRIFDYAYDNKSPFREDERVKKIIIGTGITYIGNNAFYDMDGLKEISVPNTVTAIGQNAFCSCTYLKITSLPSSVKEIGTGAFSECDINTLTVPRTVLKVGNSAFKNNPLFSVRIEATEIGNLAFSNCSMLQTVTIASSVKKLGTGVFASSDRLKTFRYEGSTAQWNSVEKPDTWYSSYNEERSRLECLDGYFEYSTETNKWTEVKKGA